MKLIKMKIEDLYNQKHLIENEIEKWERIRIEVELANNYKACNPNMVYCSQAKYDSMEVDPEQYYYIIEPEIGQYIEGYLG